ncbi:hypothetical protein Pint_10399 [Pistacia integerrima]|uniref:Uncharacterized protein n=1 Tax=Pistacia integerrima TaxID=434235 RepID=A0ACC0XL38_9ROSI|nr:hypothetical protein Pint_10399 [Pistacia integerrima]
MAFRHKETVEIHKKQEGFSGPYYTATILAAIGKTKYLVRYETRFAEDRTRLLTEAVDEADVRPLPPTNLEVSDNIVDAYVNDGWIHLEWEDGKWVYPGNSREVPSSDF